MRTLCAATLFLLTLMGNACAWNGFGHMEVAAVAWEILTPVARVEAIKLIKLNPQYGSWIAEVPEQEQGKFAFMKAATWADAIKSMPGYLSDGITGSNGNRPMPGAEASQNIGYVDHLRHKYWHFTDAPFSTDGTRLIDPETPNVQTQIALFRTALQRSSGAPDAVRSYDLVWLLHLVGDVHQPLHTTSRFSREHPEGDQGGNLVMIDCGAGCRGIKVLHAFWDDVLGTGNSPEVASRAASELPAAKTDLAAISDEKAWIEESFRIARDEVYALPPTAAGQAVLLGEDYKAKARSIANERVALAGARLAHLINEALK